MMARELVNNLLRVLNVNDCQLVVQEHSQEYIKTKEGHSINGPIAAARYVGEQSGRKNFIGADVEESAAVYQWVEYCFLNVSRKDNREVTLKELNDYLENEVFFVGNRLTLADVVLFLALHDEFANMSFQEKEIYVHLSRWFKQGEKAQNKE